MVHVPFPVRASHDIRQGTAQINRGTRGEVIGTSREAPYYYYSVVFWLDGADDSAVRFDYLTQDDIREG
jgi:hypothetical protein